MKLIENIGEKYKLDDIYSDISMCCALANSFALLGDCLKQSQLGEDFGATLTAREVEWLMQHEFAQSVEDIIWRRTKLGLKLSDEQQQAIQVWINQHQDLAP